MRVTILSHYYPPETGAPQARLSALAEGLSTRGFAVTVHTCVPHYPDGRVQPPYRNSHWQQERANRLDIVRTAVIPLANQGVARRIVNHASFAASSALSRRAPAADAVVVESPPLFLAAAAVGYARRRSAPLVVNVADLWPDSAIELGVIRNRSAIRVARAIEGFAYRHASALTTPTGGIASILSSRTDVPDEVVRVAPFVDRERFSGPRPERRSGPLRVLYAGTVGLAQGLETLVEAAKRAGPSTLKLSIVGGGADLTNIRRLARQAPNIDVRGLVRAEQVPSLYQAADVAVVLLRDRPIFRGALPTKMFEAMAAGTPLVLAAAGESADLVERYGCGIVVNPDSAEALADAFRTLARGPTKRLEAMGAAGRRASVGHSLDAALDVWQDLLERVVQRPRLGSS